MNTGVPSGPVRVTLEPADELVRRIREILRAVAALTGEPDLATHAATRDLVSAEAALRAAEHVVVRELAAGSSKDAARLAALLAQVGGALAAVRDSRLAVRTAAMADLHHCLARLRAANTLQELAQQVPAELHRLGYRRALFSRLSGPTWSPRSAYAYADPQLAEDLVRIGTAVPGQIGRELPETEVVRTRAPVLVEDAQHNPRVHHRLINLARTLDYVVAPLVGRGEVVGLVHADQHVEHDHVDEFDLRLLGLFAEGLGCVFERVVFSEQLGLMRERMREQARVVDDLLDGYPPAPTRQPEPPRQADPLGRYEGPFAELTRRELDVLRHLVLGESNSQIAAALFVAPGTVKTHVKNVLRKLGVANRAEATARYHELMQRHR
ncbi:LuxR C-terminal-related transcriptional regulator [Amycolatopsis acidiphila]|uniref:LuxR C-terminal-related transcriptional regulator n=1 Tax=Amycolatopsis acidiphila TaxID=715473 RepID=UPI001643D329|nr:LuxR C-terminal-related transcriptional regulator [Amycolatopsis acidiphila]UIJ57472.1 LuxR C-terminal-related transcriptional regulator [Amycolatopsis acidiphila]GHG96280.1 LuxR family transcriptional regulator [Amycolatopsis acidiphila]